MTETDVPPWFQPGAVPETIRDARQTEGVDDDDIARVLSEREFDVEVERARRLLDKVTVERTASTQSQEVEELEEPREGSPRRFAVSDVQYLDRREFARVLGGVVTRYGGSFRTAKPEDGLVTDLFWNRQHTTVGLRAEPRGEDATVDAEAVEAIVEGDTDPIVGRSPSRLAIVSNRGFTDEAKATADAEAVELIGPAILRRWLTDARLPRSVASELVRAGGLAKDEFGELLDSVPQVPAVRRPDDPLRVATDTPSAPTVDPDPEPEPSGQSPSGQGDGTATTREGPKRAEPSSEPGEYGTLYDEGDELDGDEDESEVVEAFTDGLGGDQA
jgi:hypothetical protein